MQRLRSLCFAIFYGLSILAVSIVTAPAVFFAPSKARSVAKWWARMILPVLKFMTGITYKIEGAENIPHSGAIIASNHQSQWETIALYAHLPNPVVIVKKELFKIPLYGWWMARVGNIPVDRTGGAKALRAMRARAAQSIEKGEQIVVFPESTRSPVGSRPAYHPGVAGVYQSADAPCVPAAHDSGRFWRFPGIDKVPGEITLRFLPPIAPGLDRKAFMAQLKNQIEGARPDLQAPLNDQGSSDG